MSGSSNLPKSEASKPVEKLGRRSRRPRITEKVENVEKVKNFEKVTFDKNVEYEILTDNLVSKIFSKSSCHSSMVSIAACYWGGPGFKSRHGRELLFLFIAGHNSAGAIYKSSCDLLKII